MNKTSKVFLFSFSFALTNSSFGYELATHSRITLNAYERSSLSTADQTADALGLGAYQTEILLSSTYNETIQPGVVERNAQFFVLNRAKNYWPSNIENLTAKGWLMRGAIREDDYINDDSPVPCNTEFAPNPQDENPLNRPINHFYDPVYDRGLSAGSKSFDWGLGTADALADQNIEDTGRTNHYTLFDAREAMYRAVTMQTTSGTSDVAPDGNGGTRPPLDAAEGEQVRNAYWATTFRILGDLTHLIQDVAQPQHTRNDPHLTECSAFVRAVLGGKSLYEAHVNARAKQENYILMGTAQKVIAKGLVYDGYPIPRFNDYLSYFTTRHQQTGSDEAAIMSRRGLADYSNRSFFTTRTNFTAADNPNYTLPPHDLPAYGMVEVSTDWAGENLPNGGKLQLLTHDVEDSAFPAERAPDVPLTTYGLWDQYLNDEGFFRRYSLNLHNYDAMADLLIPRAVAYSAGFLDYFFRGRMDIAEPDEGLYAIIDHSEQHTVVNGVPYRGDGSNPNPGNVFGFDKIRAKVRNATPAINDGTGTFPQDFSNGELLAVARFRTNPCYSSDLSGEFIDGGAIPNGCNPDLILNSPQQVLLSTPITLTNLDGASYTTFEFDFRANPIPVNATDFYLQLIYRGELGSEQDAVVVATKDLYEPTYLSFANNTDFINLDGTINTKGDIESRASKQQAIDQSPQGNSNGIFDESIDSVPADQLTLRFNGSQAPAVTLGALPAVRYTRVAALSDKDSFTVASTASINGRTTSNVSTFQSALNQFLLDENDVLLYRFRPMSELRGYRYYSLESLHIVYGVTDTVSNTEYMNTLPAVGDQLLPYPAEIDPIFSW